MCPLKRVKSNSSPETPTPGGISRLSTTSPVRGSTRLKSLSSPSQVPCQSSPSIQVTPVTKRLDSIVRRIAPVWGIDLMDLPTPILPHPERPFGPREPRVTAAARRRDRGEHPTGIRIDLLDAILGQPIQMLAVEGRSCIRGGKAGVLDVVRDASHAVGTRKGSVLTDDLGG